MAFTNSNDYITGRKPVPTPAGLENITQRFTIALATGDLALNTIGQIGVLPAGCIPTGFRVEADDLDSGGAAAIYQFGIWDGAGASLSVAADDGGGAWGDSGAAVNTAFDRDLTRTLNNMSKVVQSQSDRKIGMKVTTAPTTPVAGNISVLVTYRPA